MGDREEEDDDVPQLSAAALAALQEFYEENEAGTTALSHSYTVGAIQEDWRMSQFWYSEETATRLAEEAVQQAGKQGRIACISAPSIYQKLKQLESQKIDGSHRVSAVLLEFDRRFTVYGDEFIFYDYNNPLCLPEDVLPQSFDIVVADPPYLSEECLYHLYSAVRSDYVILTAAL